MEYPGIEPGVYKDGGFTVHCITIDASTPWIGTANLVGAVGIEPTSFSASDFKSDEFTWFLHAPLVTFKLSCKVV